MVGDYSWRTYVTYIRYVHTVSYYPGTRMHRNGIFFSHLREAVGKVHWLLPLGAWHIITLPPPRAVSTNADWCLSSNVRVFSTAHCYHGSVVARSCYSWHHHSSNIPASIDTCMSACTRSYNEITCHKNDAYYSRASRMHPNITKQQQGSLLQQTSLCDHSCSRHCSYAEVALSLCMTT